MVGGKIRFRLLFAIDSIADRAHPAWVDGKFDLKTGLKEDMAKLGCEVLASPKGRWLAEVQIIRLQ